MSSISNPIRLGAAGLGRAFALSAPAIYAHPGVQLVAGADPRDENQKAFQTAFASSAYADVVEMVNDPSIEAIYISTPHQMHKDHALSAISAGKHVLIEKPITISIDDASEIIEAAEAAGVWVVVGPSHSFDGPVAKARNLIDTGTIGNVRMIHALYMTDFLYRPRHPEELNTHLGGGAVFSQAIHQIDLVRRLAGVPARTAYAKTGGYWDPERPTEGAYSMILTFDNDIFANLTYSGYAHFDGDRLMENVSELGVRKQDTHSTTRQKLMNVENEEEAKAARGFTSLEDCPQSETHEHFGQVFIFGDHGDLRLTPYGVELTNDTGRTFFDAPFRTNRAEVFDTLYDAIRQNIHPLQDGRWGRASLELCHALLDSVTQHAPITLHLQKGKNFNE